MASLLEGIHEGSNWVVLAFAELGRNFDYSLDNLKDIDLFFDDQTENGQPKPGSLLDRKFGYTLFSISAYVGETLIKNCPGSEWITDDTDPHGELNIAVKLANGHMVWPGQKVIKRLKNGPGDSLYGYAYMVLGKGHRILYRLHITRKKSWSSPEGKTITEEEFKRIQQELKDSSFQFKEGNIYVIDPNHETIEKLAKVAHTLAAKVEGDDREIYADYTEVHSPLKSDYRKVRKANLPEGFPVIDDINREAKVVTKMEVLDLRQKEYQDVKAIEAYIRPYIEKLEYLSRVIWNGYNLAGGKDWTDSVLEIAIPDGKVTPAQRKKLYELQEDARDKGIRMVIAEVE